MEKVKVLPASGFVFTPPSPVAQARRVLIKPQAPLPLPHPATVSRETLGAVIAGIRRVSDADIVVMEGNPRGKPMLPIYKALNYSFPRVLLLDVKDSQCVEIDNPLSKPYTLAAACIPTALLSCDYWISLASFQVIGGSGSFTIPNLLGLLPPFKHPPRELRALGMDKVIADLYFILPFDLGIIDGRKKLVTPADPAKGQVEDLDRVLVGDPLEVDREASALAGVTTRYLKLIDLARKEVEG